MTRFLIATVLLAVSLSSVSAGWDTWRMKERCYCNGYGQNGYGQNGYGQNGYGQNGYEEYGNGYEVWVRYCTESDGGYCDGKNYEEQQRPCYCKEEPVLTPGEIAGIVVGAVVFLILIIIIIIWCVYCGCDCGDCDGRHMRRYDSDVSIYRGKVVQAAPPTVVAGPHLHAPVVQSFQPAPVTYAVPAPKPVTFTSAVQQGPVIQQHGAVYAKTQAPALTYVV